MKILDPFAGYRLASGHPIFHISLFVGSYAAEMYAKREALVYVQDAFWILRWAHFSLFTIAMISAWVNVDSEIPEPAADEKATREEVEMENMQIRHRDSVYKLVGRVLDTMSVFMYQTAIFYVQMQVYNH